MAMTRNAKLVLAIAIVLLLGIFLPPNINGTRFRDRLAPALSSALGREVKIGQVKYRLLPRPGFDIYDFQVSDDPALSAEPLLFCGKVTADLRLTSLWQGRLEIANLKLTDDAAPPSLNLVYSNRHWNVEPLLLRAEQVPSAPTAKRRAEQRTRFPYIQASNGRINLKLGPEKTPFTLANTDFAFWLASEDVWHVRLEGKPVRTDMNLNDTGMIKLEGDLRRSRELQDIPAKLDLRWENAQLGQFSSLVLGHDRGWRGGLNASAQLSGTLGNLHVIAAGDLSHFRRFDINRDSMPQLRTRCLGDFIHANLEMKCDTPLSTGGLFLTGKWSAATPRNYDLSIVANHVPLAIMATFARHARRTLPDDLTATGDLNAAFGFHSREGVRNWHGAGMTSPFLLQSSVAEKPFPVSSIKFHIGMPEPAAGLLAKHPKLAPQTPTPQPDSFTIDSFSVQLGPSTMLEVHGNVDGANYWITAKGLVPLERLLILGKVAGFETPAANFNASAIVDLNISGPWANFMPPRVRGTAHVQNLTTWISGVRDRLLLTQADAQLTDSALVLSHMEGQFEHSPVAFTGTVTNPWNCAAPPCPLEFELHSDTLSVADVAVLLGATDKGWSLPFLPGSFSSGALPDFRAHGTLSAAHLLVAEFPLENFTAHVEVGEHDLGIRHISARLGGGSVDGEWQADWTNATPRYAAQGKLAGVALDHISVSAPPASVMDVLTSWISGKADARYSAHFEGKNTQEMLASAAGKIDFDVAGGSSRTLRLEAEKPLKFQSLQGVVELEKQTLKVLPSKFRAESRIYEVSGTLTLADKQARLKVSNGGMRWEVTGDLEKPQVSPQPIAAKTTTVRTQ
jgi:AsmA protein